MGCTGAGTGGGSGTASSDGTGGGDCGGSGGFSACAGGGVFGPSGNAGGGGGGEAGAAIGGAGAGGGDGAGGDSGAWAGGGGAPPGIPPASAGGVGDGNGVSVGVGVLGPFGLPPSNTMLTGPGGTRSSRSSLCTGRSRIAARMAACRSRDTTAPPPRRIRARWSFSRLRSAGVRVSLLRRQRRRSGWPDRPGHGTVRPRPRCPR